jgi:adenylosuccinate synthase
MRGAVHQAGDRLGVEVCRDDDGRGRDARLRGAVGRNAETLVAEAEPVVVPVDRRGETAETALLIQAGDLLGVLEAVDGELLGQFGHEVGARRRLERRPCANPSQAGPQTPLFERRKLPECSVARGRRQGISALWAWHGHWIALLGLRKVRAARAQGVRLRRRVRCVPGRPAGYAGRLFRSFGHMPTSCVIGLLWGDEGKGKIIDLFAAEADWVVRYAGGHNAGHTLVRDGERLVLHLVPSAILRPGVRNVIGNGVVVDPFHLREEVLGLRARGVDVQLGENLLVSEAAHVILPVHKALDGMAEERRGAAKIGTTGRGIGPAYADRASRCGVRVGDLLRPDSLDASLKRLKAEKDALLVAWGGEAIDVDTLREQLLEVGAFLAPAIADTGHLLREAHRKGARVLCEGAQGVLLDVDHGTYPFVTSSSASTGGVAGGTGLPPTALTQVRGVVKAYATRVGSGPFPTELRCDVAHQLREAGREYGSTTGRPRRVGWFDAVAVRYSAQLAGATEVVLTNLDVLSGFRPLQVCVAYDLGGDPARRSENFPAFELDRVRPVYREFRGFEGDLSGVRSFADLPDAARAYVEGVEELIGVPIRTVSVGPGRDQVISR